MHKILLTGISGFLGSHIAQKLTTEGFDVIGLKRASTDVWRCREFENKVTWIDIDVDGKWKKTVTDMAPTTVIHCAWIGVEAKDRDDWTVQIKNISFLGELLEVSAKVQKFIFLGSQAEYGFTEGIVSESYVPAAFNAYSGVKLASLEILKAFCTPKQIDWVWLRVFSVFGEKESPTWLIPSMIKKMLREEEMEFTAGEQRYAYLYVKDFAETIKRISISSIKSGIYNVSATDAKPLKLLIEQIRDAVNPKFKLKFGALPYRQNQSMHIEGDISKLEKEIGAIEFSSFKDSLENTINYCISNNKNE
jgi:UDP-glucose 4-epimerase